MATFTSSLPDELLEELSKMAAELKVPKNKLIKNALKHYIERLEKKQYANSFKRIANDPEMLKIAEEGTDFWLQELEKYEKE